ncbi:GNAT family N-acetyltransferase [Clostridium beijerinckii]|uniref:GNAT superfamily N-acetyltransferase n=1 Tax=Clostridium beijerinckii TaxID=1520 RepID=A0A1B9BG39_CLOBE|nr:GNAT family N-acetyltransferase [Clostridium beijerinckii]AQS06637.1 putative acetyltransferase [Clostridium beijerinckii]MBA2887771.1 GNAT superfamily N-acetyltransferase [Clostridium beijerinckii]MBA2901714.1 GNAT superfamily N-acetyltransferase [Clostridium beijerinckii]MBA2911398.1 GNAT superfamily N-acetyltransferase [Clostridium beijerinckii]MBA9013740.1 GNAT superfamily N-acetyltransferase [Clostridium beijerinckii]
MNISIVENGINEIELMKSLWEQLNSIHYNKSVHFKKKYDRFTFDKRIESICKKAKNGVVKLDMLLDNETENYVGYCLSSIEDNLGEIESIFVEKKYRKLKLGDKLIKNALSWFESNDITDIQINVVYANDEALPFYSNYGFKIGNYILKRT